MSDFLDLPGLAPIRPMLADPQVTEIMINGPEQLYVEKGGRMLPVKSPFTDVSQLNFLVETLLRFSGRSVDTSNPYVNARLPDGSRINVIIPPLSLDGATVTIRKFTRSLREVTDLVKIDTLTDRMAYLLCAAVTGRLNIIFSGATGSGKTTTLGIFSSRIPESERIITIEDTAELELRQKHVVRLECRTSNIQGEGAVEIADLLRNSLRMRPTRIIIGEIRGDEAIEMIQAATSGHEGCLAVLHASSPADAISRLEMMILSRGLRLPLWAIHRQIAAAIDLIVHHEQLPDGSRKVTRMTEVCGAKDDHVELRDLFRFEQEGVDPNGNTLGHWSCTGVAPNFLPKFERQGIKIPPEVLKRT
jgi:pilus assembly protein CpaF